MLSKQINLTYLGFSKVALINNALTILQSDLNGDKSPFSFELKELEYIKNVKPTEQGTFLDSSSKSSYAPAPDGYYFLQHIDKDSFNTVTIKLSDRDIEVLAEQFNTLGWNLYKELQLSDWGYMAICLTESDIRILPDPLVSPDSIIYFTEADFSTLQQLQNGESYGVKVTDRDTGIKYNGGKVQVIQDTDKHPDGLSIELTKQEIGVIEEISGYLKHVHGKGI